jgi:hypothetical protein
MEKTARERRYRAVEETISADNRHDFVSVVAKEPKSRLSNFFAHRQVQENVNGRGGFHTFRLTLPLKQRIMCGILMAIVENTKRFCTGGNGQNG